METKEPKCNFCGGSACATTLGPGSMQIPFYDKGTNGVLHRRFWLCVPCGEQMKYARDQVGKIQAERGQR